MHNETAPPIPQRPWVWVVRYGLFAGGCAIVMLGISALEAPAWLLILTGVLMVLMAMFIHPPKFRVLVSLVLVLVTVVSAWTLWPKSESKKPADEALSASALFSYRFGVAGLDIVTVLLEIDNRSDAPQSARDFRLRTPNGETYPPVLGPYDTAMALRLPEDTYAIFLMEQSISHRATNKPIAVGATVRGWLMYELQKQAPPLEGASIAFHETTSGRQVNVPLGAIVRVPPIPPLVGFSDIQYPFVPRAVKDVIVERLRLQYPRK